MAITKPEWIRWNLEFELKLLILVSGFIKSIMEYNKISNHNERLFCKPEIKK